jgi:alginate export protein
MMHWPRGIVALLGVLAALQLSAVRSLADEPPATVVPSWLTPMAEYRFRVEGFYGGRFQADNDDTYALNRLRFGGTIHAADWFRAVVQLQDARVFLANGTPGPPFRDRLDARLAYAEIGGGTGSGLSTRAGRQELVFGDQRLIGNADWLNTGRTFDGIRTTWRRDRLSLDGFAVYTVKVAPDRINRLDPGSILFGSYAVIPKLIPRFAIDGYFIGRRSPQQITESGGTATLHSGTAGARWNSKPFRGVETGGEMAGQFGSIGDTPLRAWAGHWEVACTLAGARYRPRFASEYNFASGDRNKTDGRRQTFDQLFATGHDKYGLSDQVDSLAGVGAIPFVVAGQYERRALRRERQRHRSGHSRRDQPPRRPGNRCAGNRGGFSKAQRRRRLRSHFSGVVSRSRDAGTFLFTSVRFDQCRLLISWRHEPDAASTACESLRSRAGEPPTCGVSSKSTAATRWWCRRCVKCRAKATTRP